ncbi:MAG: hypothetical protein IKP82_08040 [Oscillospiraceae bacterium]|nr:hypothetical protein [Oscillospiraceae bacterium]
MPDRGKATLYLTGLSAAFVFLQLCVLCMGNRTGEAVLPRSGWSWSTTPSRWP